MKYQNTRILPFTLSQKLSNKDLENVAAAGTSSQTPTGRPPSTVDVVFDIDI